jgi:hypothetical protein
MDRTLIGTMRQTVHVACYDGGRTPDDGLPPDRVLETELFFEIDGTQVFDPDRIAAIRHAQARQEATDGDG